MKKSLNKISQSYNTDKKNHGFISHYDEIFSELSDNNLNIMEIGVFFGESIKMWSEYFDKGFVYGLDTFEGNQGNGLKFENSDSFYKEWSRYEKTNIHLIKCDQSDEAQLIRFKDECIKEGISFKIILDDGSHRMRDQQITFGVLFELLEDNGYYIIEDSHTSDDLVGYDVKPNFSNSTKNCFLNLNNEGKLISEYIDSEKLLTIQNKIDNVYNFTSSNNESQTLIIKKK